MLRLSNSPSAIESRRGAMLVLAAIVMVLIFAFAAFSVDIGYMAIVKGELQNAADASALGSVRELPSGATAVRTAAKEIALENTAAGNPVTLQDSDIELGRYDFLTKTFSTTAGNPNAVRVTPRVEDHPLFFAPVISNDDFDSSASAIAMLNPRDICFVVDLSGSMNDDTEPCWATDTINSEFAPDGYPTIGSTLMQRVFDDFGYGSFPGTEEYIGAPLGVPSDNYAYAEMTQDDGPLTNGALPAVYRINNTDDELTRKQKAYSWIIDQQIAVVMPFALPTPDSSNNYAYWEKYLDYLIEDKTVGQNPPPPPSNDDDDDDDDGGGGGGGGGGTPSPPPPPTPPIGRLDLPANDAADWLFDRQPHTVDHGQVAGVGNGLIATLLMGQTPPRGTPRNGSTLEVKLPPIQDSDRIDDFNNPNNYTFPGVSVSVPKGFRNWIGYRTYVQFMMDWGRDRSPDQSNSNNADPGLGTKTPLSTQSTACPYHSESTPGGVFAFPPRCEPMHSCRRALIAAIREVQLQNSGLSASTRDWVSIVTYDGLDGYHTPQVLLPLTSNYTTAMSSCTMIQAVSDIGSTTATEVGLRVARDHLADAVDGGAGRDFANKVIVLLTDGVPNAYEASQADVDNYISSFPSSEYYSSGYVWYNAPLVQASKAQRDRWNTFTIGIGLGSDYDFLDRLARVAQTDEAGMSPRTSGNPAVYEALLVDIFQKIIQSPGSRLVE